MHPLHMRQAASSLLLFLMILLCHGLVCADDTTPPSMPYITTASYQFNTDSLHASWSAFDDESGITGYEYAVGTTPSGSEVKAPTWTIAAEATLTGVALNHTDSYYWTVRARNGAGLWGPYRTELGGTVVPLQLTRIVEAKSCADGTWIYLENKQQAACMPAFSYIEESDRSSGIGIDYSGSYGGVCNWIVGKMSSYYTERRVLCRTGLWTGSADLIRPLAMRNKDLAGKAFNALEGQVPDARGANNVGLLVKTTGKVLSNYANGFYIDDGSGLHDGVKPGLLVNTSGGTLLRPMPVGCDVQVTGISSVTTLGAVPIRILRPRLQQDIVPIRTPVAYVYDYDPGTALSWKNFLESERMPTDIYSVSEAATADFSKYCLIIAGHDSGSVANWGTAAIIEHILMYNKPILGIETGGSSLFNQIGGLHYVSSTAGFNQGMLLNRADVFSLVYRYPYAMETPEGLPIKVAESATCWRGFQDFTTVPAGVSALGSEPGVPTHSLLGFDSPRYMYWGFRDKPDLLTTEGKHLFINAAWYVMLYQPTEL